jgi:hypothetical protein
MPENQLNETMDLWISALSTYDMIVLLRKPDPECWSLGQLYMHLVAETNYYIEQMERCLSSDENAGEQMTSDARTIFANNSLPDIRIKRDKQLSQDLPSPTSDAAIFFEMEQMKRRLNSLAAEIDAAKRAGKTKHPGLGYFNAAQWLQFAEIHMRHHLKQKDRIETKNLQNQ